MLKLFNASYIFICMILCSWDLIGSADDKDGRSIILPGILPLFRVFSPSCASCDHAPLLPVHPSGPAPRRVHPPPRDMAPGTQEGDVARSNQWEGVWAAAGSIIQRCVPLSDRGPTHSAAAERDRYVYTKYQYCS